MSFFLKKRCQRSATDSIPNLWMKSHAAMMPRVSPQSGVERVTPSKSKSLDLHGFYTCLFLKKGGVKEALRIQFRISG